MNLEKLFNHFLLQSKNINIIFKCKLLVKFITTKQLYNIYNPGKKKLGEKESNSRNI